MNRIMWMNGWRGFGSRTAGASCGVQAWVLACTLWLVVGQACSPSTEAGSAEQGEDVQNAPAAEAPNATSDVAAGKAASENASGSEWTDEDRIYALGLVTARGMDRLSLSPREQEVFAEAFRDHRADEPRIDLQEIMPELRDFQMAREQKTAERERSLGEAALEKALDEDDAEELPSGAVVRVLAEGEGASPSTQDAVVLEFKARLLDGTVFDSSALRGGPQTFPMSRALPCWQEALVGIKPGGKVTLTCPASAAYGDAGQAPFVSPGAVVAFDVELVEVKPSLGFHGGAGLH